MRKTLMMSAGGGKVRLRICDRSGAAQGERVPELAEVEFYRRQWDDGLGQPVVRVHVHAAARIFRAVNADALAATLTGATLRSSEAQAKQMLFRFDHDKWLGMHLGMSGKLLAATAEMVPAKHDHLVIYLPKRALVFSDPRMFGKVEFHTGQEPPVWWTALPLPVRSSGFTVEAMAAFCARRARSPIKAVLLMQERFPGIGNWMADEILWRARIHPECLAGELASGPKSRELHATIREVAEDALREIAGLGRETPPQHLSARLPDEWLFNHRWKDGGTCPQTGQPLVRQSIAGRTTCFSPSWQTWKGQARSG